MFYMQISPGMAFRKGWRAAIFAPCSYYEVTRRNLFRRNMLLLGNLIVNSRPF